MLMQNMLLILCIIAVATYVVAWIEITYPSGRIPLPCVATYVVAWIEIAVPESKHTVPEVATYVVAWIEISSNPCVIAYSSRRHLCSGVD